MPVKGVSHEPSDQVPVAFQREVAGVEQVELHRLEVSLVRLGPGRREDLVVPAPHNEHRWLVLPEVLLPLRVERRVTPVAQKQVELDLVVAFAIQQILVRGPAVRRDEVPGISPLVRSARRARAGPAGARLGGRPWPR